MAGFGSNDLGANFGSSGGEGHFGSLEDRTGGNSPSVFVPASLPPGVVDMMPLGDSITFGSHSDNGYPATLNNVQIMEGIGGDGTTGYLDRLFDLLAGAGISVVGPHGIATDTQFFRGSQTATTFNRLARSHEGHSGFSLSSVNGAPVGNSLADQFPVYWAANPASMVLLMGGSNDLNNGATAAQTANSLSACLDSINLHAPGIPCAYAIPPMFGSIFAEAAAYRLAVPPVIAAHVSAGMKVWYFDPSLVLQCNGPGAPGGALAFDGLHPNYHGYRVLGGQMFLGLINWPRALFP